MESPYDPVATNHCLIFALKNAILKHEIQYNREGNTNGRQAHPEIPRGKEDHSGIACRASECDQAVSNWENEKTQPDIDMLQKIAQILEVSVKELIYGTTKEKPEVVNNYISKDIRIVKQGVSSGAALAMVISYVK